MMKRTLKPILCAAVMALTLSITACGGSDSGSSSSASDSAAVENNAGSEEVNNDEADAEAEADAAEEANAGDDENFESLEAAFAEPEVKSVFDAMLSSMQEDGMVMTYEVTANNFTIVYQFTDDSVTYSDEIAEALETEMANQESVFKEMAGVFDDALEQEGVCTVTVRYLDYEDTVMFEGTYAAD